MFAERNLADIFSNPAPCQYLSPFLLPSITLANLYSVSTLTYQSGFLQNQSSRINLFLTIFLFELIILLAFNDVALATKTAEEGAQTSIYLSASRSISKRNSGGYYDNSRKSATSPAGDDEELAAWLWTESERLTGVAFDI